MTDLTAAIDTPAGKLTPGKSYNLTLKHGDSDRLIENAEVRAFQPYLKSDGTGDDEVRYEAMGTMGGVADVTVGFLPENVKEFSEA